MKILAIEHELESDDGIDFTPHLQAEAMKVWELYQQGFIREMYFRADRTTAVLVLESEDTLAARALLQELPLVQNGLIDFELIPLVPYPGFERLFTSGEDA